MAHGGRRAVELPSGQGRGHARPGARERTHAPHPERRTDQCHPNTIHEHTTAQTHCLQIRLNGSRMNSE
eukprot:scaffold153177_cov35-Tisochrysis_lutea.AAC.1